MTWSGASNGSRGAIPRNHTDAVTDAVARNVGFRIAHGVRVQLDRGDAHSAQLGRRDGEHSTARADVGDDRARTHDPLHEAQHPARGCMVARAKPHPGL